MGVILDVKADDKCGNCHCDFADHDYAEARDKYVCPHPHQETGYGGFKGGDPRKFSPDPECCSVVEIELYRAACKRWDDAEDAGVNLEDEPLQRCRDENGISGEGWKFGIGVYVVEFEQTWEAM